MKKINYFYKIKFWIKPFGLKTSFLIVFYHKIHLFRQLFLALLLSLNFCYWLLSKAVERITFSFLNKSTFVVIASRHLNFIFFLILSFDRMILKNIKRTNTYLYSSFLISAGFSIYYTILDIKLLTLFFLSFLLSLLLYMLIPKLTKRIMPETYIALLLKWSIYLLQ